MSRRGPLIAAAGAAGLVLARLLRKRQAEVGAPSSTPLPEGVQEFPSTFVDKRHVSDGGDGAPAPHGSTGAQVAAEFYEEHPPPVS